MKKKKFDRMLFYISLGCMVLLSISFMLMPFASERLIEGDSIINNVTGALFWLSLLGGYTTVIILNHRRKHIIMENETQHTDIRDKYPGIIRVFSNIPAKIADITFVIGLVGFIICIATANSDKFITYIMLSVTVLAFHMHCMLNGKNYVYIKSAKMRSEQDYE